jgi:phage tail sheath protein FI
VTTPGHEVTIGERTKAKTTAPSTANGFVVGFTERGPSDEPLLCLSLAHYVEQFGERVNYGAVYDALDVAFREGSSAIYVGRIVGPAPVVATDILPAAVGDSMTISAKSAGVWGNEIDVIADATGAEFTLVVEYLGDVVEASPTLASVAEAIAWAANSDFIVIEDEGGGDPIDGTANLAGGTDDNANATDASRQAALALFSKELGPGQVAAPGFTTSQAFIDLLTHAEANNRRALLDAPDTAVVATLTTASTALRGSPKKTERYGAMLAPWAVVPGLSAGTTRLVPYSAVQLGLIARSEGEGNTPNKAAAGKRGRARYATGLSQPPWDKAERGTLNEAGVTVARLIRDTVTTYGNRSITTPLTDSDWRSFSASRLMMAIAAAADLVLEDYDFEQIDGKGFVFSKLEGDLGGRACMPFYIADALYGSTPSEAFVVNTGPDVNTPQTIAAEEIHAQIGARVSPTGELLTVEVVKVPITEEL